MRIIRYQLLCVLLLLWTNIISAQTQAVVASIPDPMKKGGYVSDPDHIINASTITQLNLLLKSLDQSGKAQVAVVLLNSIGQLVPKDVAHDIFKTWKPGEKSANNGLVVLLVKDQHRIEFETGYGLEGDLPDVVCFRIQQSEMLPSFKQGNYDEGMLKGLQKMADLLEHPDSAMAGADSGVVVNRVMAGSAPVAGEQIERIEGDGLPPVAYVIGIVVYLILSLILMAVISKRRLKETLYKESWKDWVFVLAGPIVFLVIFAATEMLNSGWNLFLSFYLPWIIYLSFRYWLVNKRDKKANLEDRHYRYQLLAQSHANLWLIAFLFPVPYLIYLIWHETRMNRLRYTPLPCDDCHQLTTLLKRLKKKAYMNRLQLAEEKVGSVIYDVWYCNHCNHTKNIGYESMHSNVTPCPSCHNKTYRPTRTQVVKRATRYAEGEGIQYYECAYCNHTVKSPYTIAKLSSPSSTSSFLGSGSSGSSGGSSSSGSWGGGSSGGGGAGSSW